MGSSAHEQDDDLEDWAIDYSGQGPHARHADGVTADALSASALQPLLTTIAPTDEGLRLDTCVAKLMPQVSRSMIQKWIGSSCITIDGRVVKASATVHAGQTLAIRPPEPEPVNEWQPEPMALDIVFEDAQVMVVNKPVGLVVHPAAGHAGGTLVNGLIALCPDLRQVARAGIVHRLDRDTSGLMVVAKTRPVMDALVGRIAAREVRREYIALAHKPWQGPAQVRVDQPVGRDPRQRVRMAVVDLARHAGKPATTDVRLLCSQPQASLVHCRLHTGRTHQIRVHLAHLGHPLVGDELYGGAPLAGLARQGLHAWRLSLVHPATGRDCSWQAALPADITQALERLGLQGAALE